MGLEVFWTGRLLGWDQSDEKGEEMLMHEKGGRDALHDACNKEASL